MHAVCSPQLWTCCNPQVLRLLPDSRLLLAAPSNLAADLLALRLLQSGRPKSEMLRVCAYSRPKEDLMPGLEDVTSYDDRNQFACYQHYSS